MPLDGSSAIASQLQVVSFPSSTSSPYEVMHSLLHQALGPYFDASTSNRDQTQARSRIGADSKAGVPATKKKIAELEMSLLHLQQNIEIPALHLSYHEVAQATLDQAQAENVSPSVQLIPQSTIGNSTVINGIQETVNVWIRSIRAITSMSRDAECESAVQEINFWLSMENALRGVEEQLSGRGVQLTLEILRSAKRISAATSFRDNTGLKEALELVQNYNPFLRDLPIGKLLSATSLEAIPGAIDSIFEHVNKKLRITVYPINRALGLVEGISKDLNTQIHRLVQGRSIMHLGYEEFRRLMVTTTAIWAQWDKDAKIFTNACRDTTRKRSEKFIPVKVNRKHVQTQERLKYIDTFRSNHEQLQRTIVNVLGPQSAPGLRAEAAGKTPSIAPEATSDVDAVQEVVDAYAVVKDVDVLDVSEEGTQIWTQAEMQYNERTSRVENSIIARLRDRLAIARTANEMFRVFSKFNALLVRPKVRGAVGEYQAQLLGNVKKDITLLQERFKQNYGTSEARMISQLRDLPPVSGSIIWVRQIERQLDSYMKKVVAVLGEDWTLHTDGERLRTESELFRKKLGTRHIYEAWLHEVQKRELVISGRLFDIGRNRAASNSLELSVNFDGHVITVFKEVRNMTWLNFQIPHLIANASKEAKRVYPYAVTLMESVNTYMQVSRLISAMSDGPLLLSGYHRDVQVLVAKGMPLKWESFVHSYEHHVQHSAHLANGTTEKTQSTGRTENAHHQFVRDLAQAIANLQTKTATLASILESIQKALSSMRICGYSHAEFKIQLGKIQASVDTLNIENFANLETWVTALNLEIESIFQDRMRSALQQWLVAFQSPGHDAGTLLQEHDRESENRPIFAPLVIDITMHDKTIHLDPPLDYARAMWLAHLESWLDVICDLKRISSMSYQLNTTAEPLNGLESQFDSLAFRNIEYISSAHAAIESRIDEMALYVEDWLRYQSLWDLQAEDLYDTLADDLDQWHQLLQEIRQARSTFDTSEVRKSVGYILFDYEQVQSKITQKYDQWQQEITSKFGTNLGNRMREVFVELGQSRTDLENQSLEASSTAQAVAFITAVQSCKRKAELWEPEIDVFRQGQTSLSRQRYSFPSDWLSVNQVNDEWNAFTEILNRKIKTVDDQTDALRAKINAEDQVVRARIADTISGWNTEKPVSGTIPPDEASNMLASYRTRLERLQAEAAMVSRAKEALDMPYAASDPVSSVLEEVNDFAAVWSALSSVWRSINGLKDSLWTSVQPRKLRQSIDSLISMTKDMPSRMRQYAAFEHVQNVLRQLQKSNPILADLRSEAVRERHWIKIFKALKPGKRYSEILLTLGDVWDLEPVATEALIRDVITQARGELALEEFLKQVRDTWQNFSLDLVNYQNKCRLIRGWDDLFTKCSENLNSLQAMRHSPYYREFEEEASSWEDKLNRVHVLFDVWIDVQRQWVYLEGVFSGNNDIKHLLPTESQRFQNINTEFLAMLKKVYKSPFVLDVLAIVGVQKSLERLADLLGKIQKALGEYLERERVSFPRFYFVGDEDLLEIIGNSNDTTRVAKHFKKMFAGLAGLVVDDNNEITAITSREGERVALRKGVSLAKLPKINDWLAALEAGVKATLAELLFEALEDFQPIFTATEVTEASLLGYVAKYPAQIVVLAAQVTWTSAVHSALEEQGKDLAQYYDSEMRLLATLATVVLQDLDAIVRKKCEHLITEFVHQRDVLARLIQAEAATPGHYLWLLQMRYVYRKDVDAASRLHVEMANAHLEYGYEYLGVPDRLVRTPLTDRCFLILTQALCQRLGGSPYGPAGTGKTESVKALGLQLGRFTLVFNCDDTFDFQAMGRIFLGLCQVGAWGCFDEFNRLEERILSAVSQQIQNIQIGLRNSNNQQKAQIELVGRSLTVNSNSGIFITMNPGYAGRSNLPDNLKKLFRSVAMSKPDKELIAEVMLFSQGFKQAKTLSHQTVPFFDHCAKRLSKQAHYDFGLRALKSVLISSGGLKRARLAQTGDLSIPEDVVEPQILVQSIHETMAPKLIKEDLEILEDIQEADFPGVKYVPAELTDLITAIKDVANQRHMTASDAWVTKALQLYQIQQIHHGVMMVGGSGSAKSAIWKVLLEAMQKVQGIEGVYHIIDAKVMSKESLYGNLDPTTREWNDGLFTGILRKIVDNLRGEEAKRHWIVFDGDVDPEWVENLNSVLDDNKLLTLPNGERLSLPPNVRIMFEVETLKYATLATVSRCGMVWFNDDAVTSAMMIEHALAELRSKPFDDLDDDSTSVGQAGSALAAGQRALVDELGELLRRNDFVFTALNEAKPYTHIMEFTIIRGLGSLFGLLSKACRAVLEYNIHHPDFPLSTDQTGTFLSKKLLLAVIWAFTGDCPTAERTIFGNRICSLTNVDLPSLSSAMSSIDYDVALPSADWVSWQSRVPTVDINTHSVTQTDIIIPTVDTLRHEEVLYSWLAEHKPLLLCGPPGSGKTMTLFSALRKLPNLEVAGLNFSSATTPDLIIKTFEQYCEYRKTLNGVILSPAQIGRWLVIFCDEINLPAPDRYGTQRAISFLRQLVEQNGFWRTSDRAWVTLDRIQFVGACNPPTDVGRHPLGPRFLRHAPLIMVDYPAELSLMQIYGTFNNAILKVIPLLRGNADTLTRAMVQLYLESQARFTPKIQPHYVYSPRELTRWVRGVYEAIKPLEKLSLEGLVRIWAHEALRLFQDRLVDEAERSWTHALVRKVAANNFPTADLDQALASPILFSNWLSKNYVSVDQDQLREFVKARLKTFCDEEVDVPLVLFNEVLEHALRIDRVFRQPQGHLILIGTSGSGKTTLSRFVAWMNGLTIFQIKVHGKYSAEDFDEDLRGVLKASGCRAQKTCFIMDESNVLDSGFLERMNTLLANGEVPGLFEGDEYMSLMTACKEGAQRQGLMLDSQEELYKWFTEQIVKNLHVVFTMNPPTEGLSSRAATSPALFNRCVLNWMGDWSDQALYQVGLELTQSIDLDMANFKAPDSIPVAYRDLNLPATHRDAIINAMVHVHFSLHRSNQRLEKQQGKVTYLTPRHYLDFVAQFVKLFHEKREDLEEQQRHLNVGLEKLRDTVDKVRDLRTSLAVKKNQLERKDAQANEKLQRMVADQREAETRKAASLEIQIALEKQEKEVSERREIVLNDLAKAEPAVMEAQRSVSNIKRQHLTEVRSMGNPPSGVKLALESVCTLLGNKVNDWKSIQAVVRKEDFIANIVNYDNEGKMTASLRAKMKNEFLSNGDFTWEKVNRASKACGPLVQWVEAQVNYSEILERVGPLRAEVEQLEDEALQTKAEAKAIENTITRLEDSIATYKSEYAALISETQSIKTEMSRVQFKVDRSVRLLESLSSERKRWETGSKSFESQITTLIGDVLVASAFLAYAGLYDQQFRKEMTEDWLQHLALSGIACKAHNPITEYLSNADERLAWQRHTLPVDDLCTENAIILKRFNRYPLIIDPSNRATEFLRQENHNRKLTVTSFLDDTFVKQLESALRFGNPILIQDAEHLDPILTHVLNREYQKTGGRVLIHLGKQEIDFSPAFRLYLSTRDPSAVFAPDVCSRTTFVNFTVTRSSLRTQSLNEVLKSERPDVDKRRSNLIKMQGEFNTNLRQLEKRLLRALNESRGNILDDDTVIETLETLKKEAAVISRKMTETEGVMNEVEKITLQYSCIANACSSIFAILELLHHLNHTYQFSLQFFVDIFHAVLHSNKHLNGKSNHNSRAEIILRDVFVQTYKRTSLSMLQKDRVTLAMLLAREAPYDIDKSVIDTILDKQLTGTDLSTEGSAKARVLGQVDEIAHFKNAVSLQNDETWKTFLATENAERSAPMLWNTGTPPTDQALLSLLLVKICRMDRFVPAAERFVSAVFGSDLFDADDTLEDVVRQVDAMTPVTLSCSPGFDASYKVEALVEKTQATCANIAMGSNESVSSADRAISTAANAGTWVLVKNVHLAPQWLQSLEKRLGALNPHVDFRLFLSLESSPKIPVNLLRASRVLMYEQPAGIRANMKDSMSVLSTRASRAPSEKARLYLLLSFLHAVLQERLRYAPTLGWKGLWEFNDSDYECCAFIIDTWVESMAQGRTNVSPAKLPWRLLRSLITEMYGGKVDNEGDFETLQTIIDKVLDPAAYEADHHLVQARGTDEGLIAPSGTTMPDFISWVSTLPEREPPTYLGLPANAEKLLLVEQGQETIENLSRICEMLDDEELATERDDVQSSAT